MSARTRGLAVAYARPPQQVTKATLMKRLVAQLLDTRFATGSPRSAEYQAGTRALLEHRALGHALVLPHTVGTAQADAWFAGVEDGKALWQQAIDQASIKATARRA